MNTRLRAYLRDRIAAVDNGLLDAIWIDATPPVTVEGMQLITGGLPVDEHHDALCTIKGIARLVITNEKESDITPLLADLTITPLHYQPDTPQPQDRDWQISGLLTGLDEQRDDAGLLYTNLLFTVTATLNQRLDTAYQPTTVESQHD